MMNEVIKWASRAGAVIIAWLCRALGGWDAALGLLFLVMGLDLLTGILCAFHQKSDKTQGGGFLSRSFFLGLTRKLMMLALVMLALAPALAARAPCGATKQATGTGEALCGILPFFAIGQNDGNRAAGFKRG